jgi:hypothetical protein
MPDASGFSSERYAVPATAATSAMPASMQERRRSESRTARRSQ